MCAVIAALPRYGNSISVYSACLAAPAPLNRRPLPAPAADRGMEEVFGAHYCSLHVRVTNRGAFHLYTQTLGYK